MKKEYNQVWIRIAGNTKRIKGNLPGHWRGYINKIGDALPITKWQISGVANKKNIIHGSIPEEDSNELLAWIDFFGDVTVIGDVVEIKLSDPI